MLQKRVLHEDDYDKWIQNEKSKSNFGKLILGVIAFFVIAFAIIFVYYGSNPESNNPESINREEIDPETFCTNENKEFYDNLGMSEIFEEIALKHCP